MASVAWQATGSARATTTIFAEMSALALATQSVNWARAPDTDGPDFMWRALGRRSLVAVNQYPPVAAFGRAGGDR